MQFFFVPELYLFPYLYLITLYCIFNNIFNTELFNGYDLCSPDKSSLSLKFILLSVKFCTYPACHKVSLSAFVYNPYGYVNTFKMLLSSRLFSKSS